MKASVVALLYIFSVFLCNNIFAEPEESQKIKEILQQLEKLNSENESLKQENQVLRKLVFEKQSSAPAQPVSPPTTSSVVPSTPSAAPTSPSPVRLAPSKPSSAAVEYWITTSSGKRHNSGCRYFQTSRGRPGGSTEGTACKICGG